MAPLSDETAIGAEAEAEVEALEAEVEAELGSLARLGALLLSGASLSEEAAAALEAPALLLRRHAQQKAEGTYAEAAARVQTSEAALRRQSLSLAACELVQLPPQVAAAALATTSGAARLRLLLAQLRPIVAEMAALQALGALGDPRVAGEGLVSGVPGQPWKLRAAEAEAEAGAGAGAEAGAGAGAGARAGGGCSLRRRPPPSGRRLPGGRYPARGRRGRWRAAPRRTRRGAAARVPHRVLVERGVGLVRRHGAQAAAARGGGGQAAAHARVRRVGRGVVRRMLGV